MHPLHPLATPMRKVIVKDTQFDILRLVHELIFKRGPKFRVGCTPPSYKDIFADSCCSASLFFISTCFQLEKVSVWLLHSMF